jgi:hypothetical protein
VLVDFPKRNGGTKTGTFQPSTWKGEKMKQQNIHKWKYHDDSSYFMPEKQMSLG